MVKKKVNCCEVIIINLISPLAYYMKFGRDWGLLLNIILYLSSFSILGAAHVHHKLGVDFLTIFKTHLMPPWGVCAKKGRCF